ncbi:MAG: sugar phosphate isomerase/epimerase [Bacteroidetes bacterium]|nr:sugar phosphate isomerase/epimerase [Bacteroidota bacterium]
MIHSRRSFLKKSGITLATLSLASNPLFSLAKPKTLALQLYTVRDAMRNNPLDTLKQVAAIGYKNVEHANYVNQKFYGYTAKEFKEILADLDLKMPSGHTGLDLKVHWNESKKDFTDVWKKLVDDAAEVGQHYVVSPSFNANDFPTEDSLRHLFEVFNKSGELCKKAGMKFGYHNHDFEFSRKIGTKRLYELILENTDRNLVVQQLDTGNLFNGGTNAIEVINKYPDRFELLHVKDEIEVADSSEKYESTILGTGIAQIKEVLAHSTATQVFIVEQEAYQGIDPVRCAQKDFEVMKKWGY